MANRIPASMRTREELSALIEGKLSTAAGKDERPVPQRNLPQRFRDDGLGAAKPEDRGGVDPVDAVLDGPPDRRDRLARVLRPPAEDPVATADRPRAESDSRNRQVGGAESSQFHAHPLGKPCSNGILPQIAEGRGTEPL